MAGTPLLTKVQQVREVNLGHLGDPESVEKRLQEICQFLQASRAEQVLQAEPAQEPTHCVIELFKDWWCIPKTRDLVIKADGPTHDLYKYIAELWGYGVPLTLSEKRPQVFRFFLDIKIENPPSSSCAASELMGKDGCFVGQISKVMGTLFPKEVFVDVVVFDGSGVSKATEYPETVVRMVWPAIGVDMQQAQQVRDTMVVQFNESQDHGVKALAREIAKVTDGNPWATIFREDAYTDRAGVRMPLCDAVTKPPLVKAHGRPLNPHSILRAHYDGGKYTEVEYIAANGHALDGEAWIKFGCIRPKVPMQRSEMNLPKEANQVRRGNRIKVRTGGGSDDHSKREGGGGAAQAPKTIQFMWAGTAAEFQRVLAEADERRQLQWAQQDGTLSTHIGQARVVLHTSTGEVTLTGSPNQIRPLSLLLRAPHTSGAQTPPAVQATAPPVTSASLPSNVYAPATALQPPAPQHVPAGVYAFADAQQVPYAPVRAYMYVSQYAFTPDGAGELELAAGDHVELMKAPDDGWAQGLNLRTGKSGWFPFDYVVSLAT